MGHNYFGKVAEATRFLKGKITKLPKLIMVLSGGLDSFLKTLDNCQEFESRQIPHFPQAKAEGHSGKLLFGSLDQLPVVVLKGRYHYYEGLSSQEVVFPYFVLQELGAQFLVTTNAVGGVRADLKPGDVMVVEDHINMMGTNPLIGLSIQRPQDQFPSMQKAYDPQLLVLAQKVAKAQKLKLKKGVYLATTGPSYETPAEIKAFRKLGVDAVGMSTVFETIAARFLKMRVLTLSIIANASADRHKGVMKHSEVLQVMEKAQVKVSSLLQGIVQAIANQ